MRETHTHTGIVRARAGLHETDSISSEKAIRPPYRQYRMKQPMSIAPDAAQMRIATPARCLTMEPRRDMLNGRRGGVWIESMGLVSHISSLLFKHVRCFSWPSACVWVVCVFCRNMGCFCGRRVFVMLNRRRNGRRRSTTDGNSAPLRCKVPSLFDFWQRQFEQALPFYIFILYLFFF